MRIRRTAAGIVGTLALAAVLGGCTKAASESQASGDTQKAAASSPVAAPGALAFLDYARSANLIKAGVEDSMADDEKAKREVAADSERLDVGNAVCSIAGRKGATFGVVVARVAAEGGNAAEHPDPKVYINGDDTTDAFESPEDRIDAPMTFDLADVLVKASVTNLCPNLADLLPGADAKEN